MAGPKISGGRVAAASVTAPAAPGTSSPSRGKPPIEGTRVAKAPSLSTNSGTASKSSASLLYDQSRAEGPTVSDKKPAGK